MKLNVPLAMTIFTLALSACSNGGGGGGTPVTPITPNAPAPTTTVPDVPGEFTYEYKFNGCSTGKHKLLSKKEFCDALLNDTLNNGCARELRIENYNRSCTTLQPANPGALPAASTARCIVNGMDLKDRTFLDNINPFNPQRRQSFRDIFWDAHRQQSYNILFSAVDSYGKASFIMTPSSGTYSAMGQIQLQQKKGMDTFSVTSGLGSQIRMVVTNYNMEKEVETVCLSDKSFKKPKVDLSRVRCTYRLGDMSDRNPSKEEIFAWDTRHEIQKEIFRSRQRESIVVRLKPASQGQEERVEIEAIEVDLDKTLKAESTLNEGLQVRYQGRQSRTDLVVSCAPASK
ncbi:hypothetical protein [Bdellovibrio sp. BCCA]|uniref:hypothetical protein n=1 Tax=Bdellovibrio sp. BCCA TaxID=3136281 RepID=UPI0030F20A6F